jgi:hypothetical protein
MKNLLISLAAEGENYFRVLPTLDKISSTKHWGSGGCNNIDTRKGIPVY